MPKGIPGSRKEVHRTPKQLDWYGLPAIGYDYYLRPQLQGDMLVDQFAIESWCYRMAMTREEGGLGKFGHLKKIVNLLWNNADLDSPVKFVWNRWAEWMLQRACEHDELCIAGAANSAKSYCMSLKPLVDFITDPTHTLVFMMSKTLKGAKQRVWKYLRNYHDALPFPIGKPQWSINQISGPNYSETGFAESSGIFLFAGEQSQEKDAVGKLIGIKAPKTGEPNESFEALMERPEFQHLKSGYTTDELRNLLPRLLNLSDDRIGKIVIVIDEATDVSEGIWEAIKGNIKQGNRGHYSLYLMANPFLKGDVFGQASRPIDGWTSVTERDEEWPTATGGWCMRLNGETNPRIVEKNDAYFWLPTEEDNEKQARDNGGKNSVGYYRFVKAFWPPQGVDSGIYAPADFEYCQSLPDPVWYDKPTFHSILDPAFTAGGDKPEVTVLKFGRTMEGIHVAQLVTQFAVEVDASKTDEPISHQVVRNWRRDCERRGIPPRQAAFESSGAPTFADLVKKEWSPDVQSINTQGKASDKPVGHEKHPDGKRVLCNERFTNRATEVWYGAHPFLPTGQLRGLTNELIGEICLRRPDGKDITRLKKVESKRVFRSREQKSPDMADSFLTGIEHLKTRFNFRPAEGKVAAVEAPSGRKMLFQAPDGTFRIGHPAPGGTNAWEVFKARARRIFKTKSNLRR